MRLIFSFIKGSLKEFASDSFIRVPYSLDFHDFQLPNSADLKINEREKSTYLSCDK